MRTRSSPRGSISVYNRGGRAVKVKIKPDTYFGADPRKVADKDLVVLPGRLGQLRVRDHRAPLTRGPGWIFNSHADELYYYFLALGQGEDEVGALMEEPDEVFFSELAVERDELHVLPAGSAAPVVRGQPGALRAATDRAG